MVRSRVRLNTVLFVHTQYAVCCKHCQRTRGIRKRHGMCCLGYLSSRTHRSPSARIGGSEPRSAQEGLSRQCYASSSLFPKSGLSLRRRCGIGSARWSERSLHARLSADMEALRSCGFDREIQKEASPGESWPAAMSCRASLAPPQ